MSKLLARIGRSEAPVEYGHIYSWMQRVRAVAAGLVLVASIVASILGVPNGVFPIALSALVAVHALVRSRSKHSPVEILMVDGAVTALGLGSLTAHAHTGLVAVMAYLIAASITFGGLHALIAGLGAFAAALLVRPLLPLPTPPPESMEGEVMVLILVAVFLGGVALSLMAAATEVFKAKRTQVSALETERHASEMKNEFVSMITHELRTPLTNIAGFADTLQAQWQHLNQGDVDEFLQIIVSESAHLQNLVEDVLTIPRLEAGRLLLDTTDFSLRPVAFKVVDLLFPAGGERSASVSIGSDVITHADPNRVEQVMRNLVENARKYGGDTISVEAIPRGDDVQVVVADNGAGLPEDARDRIFEAFEQVTSGDARSESGFGLGLTVARHLVDAMGGRIWHEPGFPVGARFCFTLPKAQGETGFLQSEVA